MGVMNMFKLFLIFFSTQVLAVKGLPSSSDQLENFTFYLNADPQMGETYHPDYELQTLNILLNQFVQQVNSESEKPNFVVFNGDLVHNVEPDSFKNFRNLVRPISVPVVLVHGNHDGVYPDTQFLDAQQDLSGYRKFNYSFDYGKWHFVVIAAPEQYPTYAMRAKTINWLRTDLQQNASKPTMVFMHYHIMPVGLSELEFYTYSPMSFKNELIDILTETGDVRYVMSGHVHSGLKASDKTKLKYKGVNFFIAPTPVASRMFGEEYSNMEGEGRFYRRGYFTEVKINGEDVQLIGRKISTDLKKPLLKTFKKFTQDQDLRAFRHEGKLEPDLIQSHHFQNDQECSVIENTQFTEGLNFWKSPLRYITDDRLNFINEISNGNNKIRVNAKWGGWSQEEYIENYQIFEYKSNLKFHTSFKFNPVNNLTGGGYIRIPLFKQDGGLYKMIIFHWGFNEKDVKYLTQIWGYNINGKRMSSEWINHLISSNNVYSYRISNAIGDIDVRFDLHKLLNHFNVDTSLIKKGVLAYGVWTRHNLYSTPFSKEMIMRKIDLNSCENASDSIQINTTNIPFNNKENQLIWGEYYR